MVLISDYLTFCQYLLFMHARNNANKLFICIFWFPLPSCLYSKRLRHLKAFYVPMCRYKTIHSHNWNACAVDVLSAMEELQHVKTENIEEMCDLELRLDSDDAAELAKLRGELTERMLNDLIANKEGLAADLQQEGQLRLCYYRVKVCIALHGTPSQTVVYLMHATCHAILGTDKFLYAILMQYAMHYNMSLLSLQHYIISWLFRTSKFMYKFAKRLQLPPDSIPGLHPYIPWPVGCANPKSDLKAM